MIVLLVSGIVLGPTGFCRCHAADWLCIRGANHDGVSTESLSVWPPTKSWEVEVGEGYSSVAVSDGRVYTMGWIAGSTGEAAYSTPVPFVGEDGKRVVVLFSGTQVVGVNPADGNKVWWRAWEKPTINGVDPVVCGNRIYVSQWDIGSEMLQPGTGALTPVWSTAAVKVTT